VPTATELKYTSKQVFGISQFPPYFRIYWAMEDLPSPKPGAADIAKLTIGIAASVAGVFIPGAGALGPIAAFAIDKYVKRPEKILVDELKKGNFQLLNDEKAAAFIPMAYKFFEAAKEGEYEHNLKLLAELLKNEMQMDAPDVPAFARMTRRLEGLTRIELKVIALISASTTTTVTLATDAEALGERPFVSAQQLSKDPNNREKFDRNLLQEVLSELASRGLLIADGASRLSKPEEYYFTSSSFAELLQKATNAINENAPR
jgi:hypothetical protein